MKKRADGRYTKKIKIATNKFKYVYASTPEELEKKIDDIKDQLRQDLKINKDTFGYWRSRWEEEISDSSLTPGTITSYLSASKHLSSLDDKLIREVTADDVESILSKLADRNPTTNRPTAKSTLRLIVKVLSFIYLKARRNRIVSYNLAEDIVIRKGEAAHKRRILTKEEQQRINTLPHECKLFAMLCLHLGLRRSEALALTWSDIDLNNRTVKIDKAINFDGNTPFVKDTTKTIAGIRTVPIPDILMPILEDNKKDSSEIVINRNGKHLSQTQFRKLWNSYMTDYNIFFGDFSKDVDLSFDENGHPKKHQPKKIPLRTNTFTPHELRHTYCTNLYYAGIDAATAMVLMGHSSITVTLNIYTHLDKSHTTSSIQKLNNFLNLQ